MDERTDVEIWHQARQNGIILIPFKAGEERILTAAIREEDLKEACRRTDLNPDSWEDIYSLGIGFFINTAAPGYGETRKESYIDALRAFEELQPKVDWPEE